MKNCIQKFFHYFLIEALSRYRFACQCSYLGSPAPVCAMRMSVKMRRGTRKKSQAKTKKAKRKLKQKILVQIFSFSATRSRHFSSAQPQRIASEKEEHKLDVYLIPIEDFAARAATATATAKIVGRDLWKSPPLDDSRRMLRESSEGAKNMR